MTVSHNYGFVPHNYESESRNRISYDFASHNYKFESHNYDIPLSFIFFFQVAETCFHIIFDTLY